MNCEKFKVDIKHTTFPVYQRSNAHVEAVSKWIIYKAFEKLDLRKSLVTLRFLIIVVVDFIHPHHSAGAKNTHFYVDVGQSWNMWFSVFGA